ncbi:MAG: Flp pilus assembly protein CpaB [Methylocystis sp.]|jgi:pilus assembly protein CpaB|nr:Flp pilus assembly protein CpaB [Methylocystis sp.]MCA3583958.1 Flp pilus assembly protein CpaB [Methylocystis sp.]MCA3589564.1 Flp pilus assembly protein CpaB [Methylocystis sp.]MCA3592462.1 Flp pilus assembly protein CpaB [Methylocystis sp.]
MKPAKLIVLGVAGVAALAAAWLTSGLRAPQVIVKDSGPVETVPMTDVLVASADLSIGSIVTPEQLRWQRWPRDAVSDLMVTKDKMPSGIEEIAGSISRGPTLMGEPIRQDKLIKGARGGFMSAILPEGRRALAINIVSSGARTAGGFILPNDRVDVISTRRDDEATRIKQTDVYLSETILQNIRVLAIGQNVQERKGLFQNDGDKVVIGETATLELDPRQAEVVTLAQRTGELTLVLRSLADMNKPVENAVSRDEAGLTIVRFGVSQTIGKK